MSKYSSFILLIQAFSVFPLKLDPGLLSSKIVSGFVVPQYSYPFMAFFAARGHLCGGTIVSKKHIITAAHCLRSKYPEWRDFVIVGEHEVPSRDAFGAFPERKFGKNLIRVGRYIRREDRKDIAILELLREIEFTSRIQAACLAGQDSVDYSGMMAAVIGWGGVVGYEPGSSPPHQEASDKLKETSLKVLAPDSKLCIKSQGNKDDQLCTYSSGSDTCQGDSGGPVFVRSVDVYVIIGVVSRGNGCAARGHAGVNVRVSYVAQWINNTVGNVCISQ